MVVLIFPIVALVFCDLPNSVGLENNVNIICLLCTSPSPPDGLLSRMPSSA